MKIQLGILFIGALVLVSGCARKCPPCPTYGMGSTGAYTSSAQESSAPASSNYSNAASGSSASPYAGSGARYVSK